MKYSAARGAEMRDEIDIFTFASPNPNTQDPKVRLRPLIKTMTKTTAQIKVRSTRATLGRVTDGSTMQDWIRRSLTAATNKNDNNRAANHCVIGRPSFGSVSRSPLTGQYSSVQDFKAPLTSQPSTAARQKRSNFSQWL